MAEEGAAKLRLKPRKAPAACSREPGPGLEPPRRRQALADKSSWFEKDDLNECEKTWILLLKNISQDLQCTSWQAVSSFPEFFGKAESSEKESLQKTEVFKIGMKDFEWVSFPSFCKEEFLKTDLSSPQLSESQIDCLPDERGQADELKSLPSTAEKTGCVTATDQAKNTVGEDTQGTSTMAINLKSCKVTQHNTSACHLMLSQSTAKALNFQQHCRGSVQNSKENRKQDERQHQAQMHQSSISFGKAKTVPTEKTPPLVSTPGTESYKEKTANQSEGSLTLSSCPMCQIQFSGINPLYLQDVAIGH
ncbi:Fanconi anemia core complex-associated protein 20 isoform X2 [Anas acuta]|uniref:Fanconi anemia core complex-associated protein 20 isoform X2 n=1 Tax=Anas acuta TaxID=28680 RepID=UPI0018D5FB57|nr:Fanconi anemia core complex-associated protein 20 isoform X2 [Anas platyrhynchos]